MKIIFFTMIILTVAFSYIKIAKIFDIYDSPNQRTSHQGNIIRGIGIIFPLSIHICIFFNNIQLFYLNLGLFIISFFSFLDDLKNLNQFFRLLIQILSFIFIFYQLNLWNYNIIALIISIVLYLGFLNSFNFMDGINGMLGLYCLVFIIFSIYININLSFIDNNILIYLLISISIFLSVNFKKRPYAFAGDVGSISLAFVLFFIISKLIIETNNYYYFLMFCIFGIDTGITLIERLKNNERIFSPHRKHLYQQLVNEFKIPHTIVSFFYAFFQFLINLFIIFVIIPSNFKFILSLILIIVLVIGYCILKFKVFYMEHSK